MKLVITWSVSDGCTYSCDVTQPVEYDSAEQFLVDFEEWKKTNPKEPFYCGEGFAGTDLGPSVSQYDLEVYTIDEWFAQCAPKKVTHE